MVAGEDGRWSYTPDALDEGSHSLSTTVTDLAGNVSERSQIFELTVNLSDDTDSDSGFRQRFGLTATGSDSDSDSDSDSTLTVTRL
ncbi:Ig-like domain-containing protein [Klebsiella oxytoca]|uniref:Ig-like domain-containing protein n=1 Tax=Klebsiella oxytoca TaxID=571 RepID=UPI003F65A10E